MCGVGKGCASGERERVSCDDGVARARHVNGFASADGLYLQGLCPFFQQKHPAPSARDEQRTVI
jgi:hypothetical protein